MTEPTSEAPLTAAFKFNGLRFVLRAGEYTAAEVREIPTPSIGDEWDVWMVDGDTSIPVKAPRTYHVQNGTEFFTTPRSINNG